MSSALTCSASPQPAGLSTCNAIDWLWRNHRSGIVLVITVVGVLIVLSIVMLVLRCLEKRRGWLQQQELQHQQQRQQQRRQHHMDVRTERDQLLRQEVSHGEDELEHVLNIETGSESDVIYCVRLKDDSLVVVGRVSLTSEVGVSSTSRRNGTETNENRFVDVEIVGNDDNGDVVTVDL